uniref:Uncharacterized protein n=1 Tax=Arundo donax TaxID=35708 RepID=A0A0A9FK07_ARUDO
MSIIGTEACKTPVMADTMNATSPQRSKEEPVDLMRDNMQSMQEPEPSICTGNEKQLSDVNENEHNDGTVHSEIQTRLEADNTGVLDNASMPSLYTLQEEAVQHKFAKVWRSEKKQGKRTSSSKKPRAHISRNKGKIQKEVCSDKEAETVIDPSNFVPKTKQVPKKRIKKAQNDMERVAQDDGQSSSITDQNSNSQHVKKTRRKNIKNAFCNQGTQTREEHPETAHIVNSPDNSKPLGVAASSFETRFPKM